jgi:hypothetical protein
MKLIWSAFAVVACAWTVAHADPVHVQAKTACGSGSYVNNQEVPLQTDLTGAPCPPATAPLTVGITGFAKLSLTSASTRLSTATVGPGSAAWPTTPAIVDVTNNPASADTIYACPVGSTPTCTTATGIPIYVGQTFRFTKPSTTMTLIATSTATVEVQF